MIKKIIILITFAVLIFSCAPTINYTSFDAMVRESKNESEHIDVFTTPKSIPYKFIEIGLISVNYQGDVKNDSEIFNIAKSYARKMGADGIIYLNENNLTTTAFEGQSSTFQKNIVKFSAIVRLKEN